MNIVQFDLSAKSSRRPVANPDFLILHYTAAPSSALGTARYFAKPGVKASAHDIVDRDGTVVHCVSYKRVAWHAGDNSKSRFPEPAQLEAADFVPIGEVPRMPKFVNGRSVGVEISNCGWAPHKGPSFTGRHSNPASHSTQWEEYPLLQIAALRELVELICDEVPTLRWVCGHEDVTNQYTIGDDPKTVEVEKQAGAKVDPGPAFPWHEVPRLRRVKFDWKRKGWVKC